MSRSRTLQWITEREERHVLVHAISEAAVPQSDGAPCLERPLWPDWLRRWLVSPSPNPEQPEYDRGKLLVLKEHTRVDTRKHSRKPGPGTDASAA